MHLRKRSAISVTTSCLMIGVLHKLKREMPEAETLRV